MEDSESKRPNLAKLFQRIQQNMLKSVDGRRFIEKKSIYEIFSRNAIDLAVTELQYSESQDFERAGLAETIHQQFCTVFAILIWMHREDDIFLFRRHDVTDDRLPMHETTGQMIIPDYAPQFVNDQQWSFLPFYFRTGEKFYCYQHITDTRTILPFIKEVHDIAGGKFSKISTVTLPMSSQAFLKSPNCEENFVIAVRKKIEHRSSLSDRRYEEVFMNELRMLSYFRPLEHPNIIRLYASFTYNSEHNFLFPRLEMNLKQFLNLKERPGDFRWDSTFYFAMYGLASALETLHEFRLNQEYHGVNLMAIGYHHDFRPANILVTERTFVLADFGLGGLKSDGDIQVRWRPTPGDYFAPECEDENFCAQEVSQKIDSWAFGCLVADVVTYMQQGPNGVDLFLKSRQEPLVYNPSVRLSCFYCSQELLKPSVHKWLENLKATSAGLTEAIETAFYLLEPNPTRRPAIYEARVRLSASTLLKMVDQAIHSFEKHLNARKTDQRLSMSLWWSHMHLYLFKYAVSSPFVEHGHFSNIPEVFTACSDSLMTLLHAVESQYSSTDTKHQSRRSCEDSFEMQMNRIIKTLMGQIPEELRYRVEAQWFATFPNDHQRTLIRDLYGSSHHKKDQARRSARQRMRDMLAQVTDMIEPPKEKAKAYRLYHPSKGELRHVKSKRGHHYGEFKGKHVLVETMYWKSEQTEVPLWQTLQIMQIKAESFNLDPKPEGLRLLKCLGFIPQVNDDGYAFLYELPSNANPNGMVSLAAVLEQTHNKPEQSPELRERFQLAHALAIFMGNFHGINCLHENFGSRNVIFAMDPSTSPPEGSGDSSWSKPFVVGLQKSRPDGQNWGTEGPPDISSQRIQEEHPDYEKTKRFVMEYDYYSLGVVLLQIGCWAPLRKLDLSDLRTAPNHRYFQRMKRLAGSKFTEITRICVDGTLDRNGDSSIEDQNEDVLKRFMDKVARPLKELSCCEI